MTSHQPRGWLDAGKASLTDLFSARASKFNLPAKQFMLFDTMVIGAGPCAVAALSALPRGRRVFIATGADSRLGRSETKSVHAKIVSTATEHGEEVGIGQRIPFAGKQGGELLRPAVVGGLANYWGQQFVRYEANDPWPRATFGSHDHYLEACSRIEDLFLCTPGAAERGSIVTLGGGYQHRTPNLVVGSAGEGRLGLRTMRSAFEAQARAHGATVRQASAARWELTADGVRVFLSDGSTAEGRHLLLAAGVVGTLNLAFASCADVGSATFGDHAQSMLYTTLKGRTLPTRRADGEKHFNALAIERILDDQVTLFASLYRLSHAPLSLLLGMLKLPQLARGMDIPGLMNVVTPIQVWTQTAQMRYRLERGAAEAFVEEPPHAAADLEMAEFLRWLKPHAQVWKVNPPVPGGSFHFCAARVKTAGQGETPLDQYLAETQKGRVTAVDGSILPELGCRPSALTMMANSRRTTEGSRAAQD